jgi:type II secretory pathway component GspD/PulD (secretin)
MLVCCAALVVLGYAAQVRSAEDADFTQNMSDEVGKQDPFRMVTPIIEARKNIIEKMIGSKNGNIDLEVKPDLFVETVMLKFLRAGNIERIATNLASSYGAVAIDKETNSLIVCDNEENLRKIVYEVRRADQSPKQILIEVVLVDVQLNDDTEIGVDWGDYNFGRDDTRHTFSQTLMSNLSASGALGGSFSLVQEGLDITINALQATRDVEILASPRVLVVSGQEALIKTTEEIPYTELGQSTNAGGTEAGTAFAITTTKFKEAGITLKVTATLTDERKILIAIDAEQSINAGTAQSLSSTVPVVDKRNAKTTLLMADGQVVVMGGLRKKESTLTKNKVPLLGDLPFVGFLFSNDKTVVKNSELLVFISPHIYRDGPLEDEQMERFNELRNGPMLRLPQKERPEFEAIDSVIPSYRDE